MLRAALSFSRPAWKAALEQALHTLQEQISSFPSPDCFCLHLQGVPGSRGLPGADGRAGVMVRL